MFLFTDTLFGTVSNNNAVRTNAIKLAGVSDPGGMAVEFNVPIHASCDEITISGEITPLQLQTADADAMVFTIPIGIEYNGNFTSPDGLTVAAGYPQSGPGGTTILRVNIPSGKAVSGVMEYAYNVTPSVTSGCGDFLITADIERMTDALTCGTEVCAGESKTIIGSADAMIIVDKADIDITEFVLESGSYYPGNTVNYSIEVTNSSATQTIDAGSLMMDFYCSSNATTPFASAPFTAMIGTNATVTEDFSVLIPASPDCVGGDLVTVKVREESPACVCTFPQATLNQPLPVKLHSFIGSVENCQVNLKWNVATETNFDRYEIQESDNASDFQTIGTELGRGDHSEYDFITTSKSGVKFYRLKMIDMDGIVAYSKVVKINVACDAVVTVVYPNPVTTILNVDVSGFGGQIVGDIYNATGQRVHTQKLMNGLNELDVSDLPTSLYLLRITDKEGNTKIFKVNVNR